MAYIDEAIFSAYLYRVGSKSPIAAMLVNFKHFQFKNIKFYIILHVEELTENIKHAGRG